MSAEFEDQVPALSPEALLILVGNLSSDKFEALRTAVHSTEAYASPRPRCTKLAAVLEIPANRVKALLSVLDQIYDIVNDAEAEWPTSLADVVNSFRHLTSLQGSEAAKLKSLILKRLTLLTDRNEAAERLSKLARLRSGLIKNAVAFSSLVDLRPDFSADRKAMNGLIPTIQVRITTDATPAP
jgi:glycyl-tRNA synthetase beta subunit